MPEADLLRALPSLDRLLGDPLLQAAAEAHGVEAVKESARRRLEALRGAVRAGRLDSEALGGRLAALAAGVRDDLEAAGRDPYRRVINATGILVHTNLGRAPLAPSAARAAERAATLNVALEYDLDAGERGSRTGPLRSLLEEIFPGRTGLAVGNNAAAILLALETLARDAEVIISRGELVEIGGSFRVPEILAKSGAKLVEVGTTNRTRAGDYAAAAGPRTAAILRVHPSNFRQIGFTEAAATRELAEVARRAGVPLLVDQGSGNLIDLTPFGIRDEPEVQAFLDDGADLVTFSGDKLLGGPQAGIAVGRRDLVERLASNPLARALRPDKMILAALIETLRLHRRGMALAEIPILRHLAQTAEAVQARAREVAARLAAAGVPPATLEIFEGLSEVGGGSAPGAGVPTALLAVRSPRASESDLAAMLRRGEPAIIGRIAAGRLLLDLRSVDPGEDELLAAALAAALRV